MSTGWAIAIVAGAWVLLAGAWWLVMAPTLRRIHGQSAALGVVVRIARLLVRWRHHLHVEGLEHVAMGPGDGPLIVVANHTGGVDPLLVQYGGTGVIQWMMARDMMGKGNHAAWAFLKVIPVNRSGQDPIALRKALRLLRDGGILGIFAEGFITRPPGTIRPFQEGIGLLAARSGAPVQPCWISGTPAVGGILRSILGPSRARVVFLPRVTFTREQSPAEIAEDLRGRIARASGWPTVDEPMPLVIAEP